MPIPLTSLIITTASAWKHIFPNGINRNICKKCRASASSHRRAPWEPSEDRTLTSLKESSDKSKVLSAVAKSLDPAKTCQLFWFTFSKHKIARGKNGETSWELLLRVQVFPFPCPWFLWVAPTALLPLPASCHQATWIGDDSQLSELKWQAKTPNHAPECPDFSAMTSIFLIKLSVHCS